MKTIINFLSIGLLGLSSLSYDVAFGQSWSLTGNAGTNAGTNFIGTTDNIALRFRTNNSTRMSISSGGKIGIGILVPIFKLDVRAGSINTDSLYRINGTSVLSLDNSNRIQLGDASVKVGIGTSTPTTALQVAGTVTATDFSGGGVGLTSLNAGNITTGTLSDSRLSSNVALVGSSNTFTNSNVFTQDLSVNDIRVGKGAGSNMFNTSIGMNTLVSNTSGTFNTAIGRNALTSNTLGSYNTALGYDCLQPNTTGENNVAVGYRALPENVSGSRNTAIGSGALLFNTTGNNNVAVGNGTMSGINSGSFNTAVNYVNGIQIGDYNSSLGHGNYFYNDPSNSTALGSNVEVFSSNTIRIGNSSVISIAGFVGFSNLSDGRIKESIQENVPGLLFIKKLRPVTYHLDLEKEEAFFGKKDTIQWEGKHDIEKIQFSGFIAQEVEKAAAEIGYEFSGIDKPQTAENLYALRYGDFVVPIIKAIQEQQDVIEQQQTQINELKAELETKSNSGAIKLGVNDNSDEILLGQNIPNPADNSTIIPFSIPANCKSASILITDHATGRAIKAVPLSCKDTHLMLDAGSLASGTYSYTLFVDGASVDTKQMVIVK